jgi:hypothetical protein
MLSHSVLVSLEVGQVIWRNLRRQTLLSGVLGDMQLSTSIPVASSTQMGILRCLEHR